MHANPAEAPGSPVKPLLPERKIPAQVVAAAILLALALLLRNAEGAIVHFKSPARLSDSIWFGAAFAGFVFNGLIIVFIAKAHNWARVVFLVTLILTLPITLAHFSALTANNYLLLPTGVVYLCQFCAVFLLVSTPGSAAFAPSGRPAGENQDRSPAVACLLAVLTTGLGLLYVGRPRAALVVAAIPLALFYFWRLTGLVFMPWGLVTFYFVLFTLWLGLAAWCGVLAKKSSKSVKTPSPRWYIYLAYFVGCVTFVLLVVRTHAWLGAEMYSVPSDSMSDTIDRGDFVIADTWAYWNRRPQRGDVVIFRLPKNPSESYIKRIIGLPGDRLEDRDGRTYVDGRILNEPYVRVGSDMNSSYQNWQQTVPADSYFVLGDNRDDSLDSREYGAIPVKYISAKVRTVWLSADPNAGLMFTRIGYVK